jgi:hypothetical protein
VGAAADGDAAIAARLAAEVERAAVASAELGTDGSAKVTVALGVEAIRQAVTGPRVVTGADGDDAAKVFVIDGSKTRPSPAVGLALEIGGTRWDGPLVWVRDRADAPAGTVVAATAGTATKGVLAVSGISTAPPAGALVVVVVPEKKR